MLGELIAAGASLAGGLLGKQSQDKANKTAQENALRQEALQKEFAQSGIQWKVKDAEAAGVHPLFALGANTTSYQPTSVGGGASDFSWLGETGQNIGRAIDATRSNPGKMSALAQTAAQVQLQGLELDNEIKRTQIASAARLANQTGSTPGLPALFTSPSPTGMEGQGDAPQVDLNIKKTLAPSMSGVSSSEAGAAPETAIYKTRGGYSPQIPQNLSESFEQDWPGFYQWMLRNKTQGDSRILNAMPKRPGQRPYYNVGRGEYKYSRFPTFQKRAYNRLAKRLTNR